MFQSMKSIIRSNNLSLQYQRFAPSGCKDIEIRNWCLGKIQFHWFGFHVSNKLENE